MLALRRGTGCIFEETEEGSNGMVLSIMGKKNELDEITVICHVLIPGEGFHQESVTFQITWPPSCVSVFCFNLI